MVESFSDYHDIYDEACRLNDISEENIKYKEVGFNGMYYAIFYIGKLPAKKVVTKLLDAAVEKNS